MGEQRAFGQRARPEETGCLTGPQTTEGERSDGFVRRVVISAFAQLGQRGPRAEGLHRSKAHLVGAFQVLAPRVGGQESVQGRIIRPGGDESDATW